MITTKQLTDNLLVCGQPQVSDVAAIAAMGVKAVVCNRPDGEELGQPTMDAMAAALAEHSIPLVRYPVNPTTFPGSDITVMGGALGPGEGKVLAYCRTGTRSANLWVVSRPTAERTQALETARRAGFEVSLAERVLAG